MTSTHKTPSRTLFATRIGVLAATVGSAVGLGNIWRFPYEAGAHGGGAFMLCNLVFTLLIGIPILCAEFILGRSSRSNVMGAFRKLAPRQNWRPVGYLCVFSALLIPGFYSVVAGWTMEYFAQSAVGALDLGAVEHYHEYFDTFSSSVWTPLIWIAIFIGLNFVILICGTRGIERASNILMPVLFVILIIFAVNSMCMDGASEGLYFLFHPDWSAIDSSTVLSALGQSFFSLSLGLGCMTTYASYFSDSTRIGRSAVTTACLDLIVAIFAGVIIFPAVFTYGGSVEAGPKLVFEILPGIFHHLPFGAVWSALFFFLLILASLTSTISMHEIVITFLTEEKGMSRRNATILECSAAFVLAVIASLSFGPLAEMKIFSLSFFSLLDFITSNVMLPIGGLCIAIFAGYVIDRNIIRTQMTNNGRLHPTLLPLTIFSLRYLCPLAILLIFLSSLSII